MRVLPAFFFIQGEWLVPSNYSSSIFPLNMEQYFHLKIWKKYPFFFSTPRLNPASDRMAGCCHSALGVQQRFFGAEVLTLANRSKEQMNKVTKWDDYSRLYLFLELDMVHKVCSTLSLHCMCSNTSFWSHWRAVHSHRRFHYSFCSKSFSSCLDVRKESLTE